MNLSLNWFKSEKKKQIEALQAEKLQLENELLRKNLQKEDVPQDDLPEFDLDKVVEKPYKTIRLVNDFLTIVMNDGSVLSKGEVTAEQFADIRLAKSEKEIYNILKVVQPSTTKEEAELKEKEEIKDIIENFPTLESTEDFVVEEGTVYLKELYDKGVKRSIPKLLVYKFVEISRMYTNENGTFDHSIQNDAEYNSLRKFWLKCCLNPNAQSAEDLYEFLSKHNMKIDRHGNFYCYRRVVSVRSENSNKALVDFISNGYNKIKAVWKKKPANYVVLESDGGYKLGKVDSTDDGQDVSIGNLEDLYKGLSRMEENRYTDAHTGKMDYRVGQAASIPRNEGDDNNRVNCSAGLHICSKEYNYQGFGDTPILAIVNPMDVLAAPINEVSKLRTARWFFAMTLPEDEKYILEDKDFDVSDLGDEFEEQCSVDLVNYVHESISQEVKRHTFNIPELSGTDITNIVKSLDNIKEVLKGRVTEIN